MYIYIYIHIHIIFFVLTYQCLMCQVIEIYISSGISVLLIFTLKLTEQIPVGIQTKRIKLS